MATLLAGVISLLWPMYLKELSASVKDRGAWDAGDKILGILGPGFLLWVLSVSIYQFAASVTEVGTLLLEAITQRDYRAVQGCALVIAVLYVGVNLLVDLLYAATDPRIRV